MMGMSYEESLVEGDVDVSLTDDDDGGDGALFAGFFWNKLSAFINGFDDFLDESARWWGGKWT